MKNLVICEEQVSVSVDKIRQAVIEAVEEDDELAAEIYASLFVDKKVRWIINPDTGDIDLTIRGTGAQIKKVLSTIAYNGVDCKKV